MKFYYFQWMPILIPFVVGIFKFKSLKELKWLFYFVCYGVANEITSIVLIYNGAKNTMPLSHLYTYVSFILLCTFYRTLYRHKINKKWFFGIMGGFTLFYMIYLPFRSIYSFPSLPQAISIFIIIAFAVIYFYHVMVEARITNLWKEPLVWINIGMIIYFSASLFYSILFNLILDYSRAFSKLTTVYFSVSNALFYFLIAVGFSKKKNRSFLAERRKNGSF